MKAAIFNPYLDTMGGGERYTLSFAKALIESGWKVDLEWSDPVIKEKLSKRFGIDLSEINVIKSIERGDGCDLCFWVSDGSIPTLRSRKNILHFQVPFHDVGGKSLLNKMKMFRIEKIVCNSHFTKKIIDKEYGVNSIVIYPPVSVSEIKSKRKENIILYVGRFSELKQSKRQDVLVKYFKRLNDSLEDKWKLILAGGVEMGAGENLKKLKKMIKGSSIEIVESPDFKTLKDLYGRSKIFWSASGYKENEVKNPEKVEHFGMTIVEAMAAGCVPIVYNAGGHKEIIEDSGNGFLWSKPSELISKTKRVIFEKGVYTKTSQAAKEDCLKFSYEEFKDKIRKENII